MDAARQAWLAAHPYLAPMDRLQRMVEEEAARGARRAEPAPGWDSLAEDCARGVPLLHGAARPRLSAAAADELSALVDRLAEAQLPGGVAGACRELRDALRSPAAWSGAMGWVFEGAPPESAPVHAGIVKFLGWTAARRVLEPATAAISARRDELVWGEGRCPTCGSLPAMAQLEPGEAACPRSLVCGCCATAWRYRRIGCPFCGNDAPERLGVFVVEEEERLRIDVCEECRGYVKTYAGKGDEELFLADWPTLHLDLLAEERGFQRLGASLYELPRTTHHERRADP